jgi:hypothetical protein
MRNQSISICLKPAGLFVSIGIVAVISVAAYFAIRVFADLSPKDLNELGYYLLGWLGMLFLGLVFNPWLSAHTDRSGRNLVVSRAWVFGLVKKAVTVPLDRIVRLRHATVSYSHSYGTGNQRTHSTHYDAALLAELNDGAVVDLLAPMTPSANGRGKAYYKKLGSALSARLGVPFVGEHNDGKKITETVIS